MPKTIKIKELPPKVTNVKEIKKGNLEQEISDTDKDLITQASADLGTTTSPSLVSGPVLASPQEVQEEQPRESRVLSSAPASPISPVPTQAQEITPSGEQLYKLGHSLNRNAPTTYITAGEIKSSQLTSPQVGRSFSMTPQGGSLTEEQLAGRIRERLTENKENLNKTYDMDNRPAEGTSQRRRYPWEV